MERTALRLATCAALLNGGNGPPWPTVAGEYVYDSMMDTIVDIVPSRRRPVIVVRTDDDQHAYNRFTYAGRQTRLLIEFGVLTSSTIKINGVEEARVDWPRTDSALEAFLDMLEWQVQNALFGYGFWARWYDHHYGNVMGYQSVPRYSAPERGAVRLAVRTLSLLLPLPRECKVYPVKEFDTPAEPVLPPGWLNVVECILRSGGGDFKKAVTELAKVVTTHGKMQPTAYPPLQRVWGELPQWNIEAMWPIEQEAPFTVDDMLAQPPDFGAPNTPQVDFAAQPAVLGQPEISSAPTTP